MSKKNQKVIYSFKVQDGSKEREFALLSPTRAQKQDGDIYYTAQLSKMVSAGILPRAIWEKVIKNNGGTISEPDRKEYSGLYKQLVEVNSRVAELLGGGDEDQLEEDKKSELAEAQAEIVSIRKEMQSLESEQINLYENTAEAKARNQTIIWWSLSIAAEKGEDGVFKPIFAGNDMDERMEKYDELVDGSEFFSDIVRRINYLATIWYIGAATKHEEFASFDSDFSKEFKVDVDKLSDADLSGQAAADGDSSKPEGEDSATGENPA
jgi:hypothetical protein